MNNFMEENLDLALSVVLEKMQNRIIQKSRYFGIKSLKNPLDFWIYQEIICQKKPDVLIEFGNNWGGSTLAFAHIFDLLDHGRVIGVDICHDKIAAEVRTHPRIDLIEQPAIEAYDRVVSLIDPKESVLIIEDSSHTYENTLEVLRRYSSLVKPGDYFVVEDSICHHGLDVGPNPGPFEAIGTFLSENDCFISDREMESFFVTWNPKGFLQRIK